MRGMQKYQFSAACAVDMERKFEPSYVNDDSLRCSNSIVFAYLFAAVAGE
jgi:hypothetical protein